MSNRRFVLLCQHFYPEMISTGMHMTELATRLTDLGWEVVVYCAKPSWGVDKEECKRVPKELVHQGIRILRVPTLGEQQKNLFARALFALSFLFAVVGALWAKRAEYHGLVVTTNPPFLGMVGWLFSRLFQMPYLLIVYDVYPDFAVNLGVLAPNSWLTKLWRRITRLILSEAATTVVIGRDMMEVIKGKMPPHLHERIVLIPNWSDERHVQPVCRAENRFRQEHHGNETFVVQYAGRMGRTHNLEPLLEAARIMAGENVLFQFIGEGAKKAKLEQFVAEHGLCNVQFLPYQPMARLGEMLSAADLAVVCLESFWTGLSVPSKAYGVMASGTPILAFLEPVSEIGQVIAETGCGLVMRDPTAHEVVTAIQSLIADPARRSAMGNAGRKVFLEKYSLQRAALAYDIALTRMLNNRVTERILEKAEGKTATPVSAWAQPEQ